MRNRRRGLWVLGGILIAARAAAGPFITVNPEPTSYAWWLRSELRPFGTELRGIPVRDIDRNWCKANEFTIDLFPPEVRFKGDDALDAALKESGSGFSISGQFGGARPIDVFVGVYETCSGQQGTFLIALQDAGTPQRVVDVVKLSDASQFAVLHRGKTEDHIELWWCFSCDDLSTFKWNGTVGRFELDPELEQGIANGT